MQVVMQPQQFSSATAPAAAGALPSPATAAEREALIEIERMRLVAEREREREEARDRRRQEREERRREREEARERKRAEATAATAAEDRRRAERDERTQAMLMAMMKDMAAVAGGRREPDPLMQALLAKVLERQENRSEVSELIKTQAELGRLNTQSMLDQWRTMMQLSAETQARLISQAVESVAQREGGGFWDAAGGAIAQALPTLMARWAQPAVPPATTPPTMMPIRIARTSRPAPAAMPAPATMPTPASAALPAAAGAASASAASAGVVDALPMPAGTAPAAPTSTDMPPSAAAALHLVRRHPVRHAGGR